MCNFLCAKMIIIFLRFIIGEKGTGVSEMMKNFNVNIRVPAQDAKSDVLLISGVPTNVDAAKIGLAEKVTELEAEKEFKIQKSFEVTVEVNPEYHPKIIGRGGAVIIKLRDDFGVQIQLPKKAAENSEVITITGFEADANAAKEAILKIVGQNASMVHEEVSIDPRVHSMIIGKIRSIRKIMDDFKVDIRLPREGDDDPSRVVVSGDVDAVIDCIDHLKIIEEEFIQEAADNDWMRQFEKPTRELENKDSNKDSKGFYVAKVPWDVSSKVPIELSGEMECTENSEDVSLNLIGSTEASSLLEQAGEWTADEINNNASCILECSRVVLASVNTGYEKKLECINWMARLVDFAPVWNVENDVFKPFLAAISNYLDRIFEELPSVTGVEVTVELLDLVSILFQHLEKVVKFAGDLKHLVVTDVPSLLKTVPQIMCKTLEELGSILNPNEGFMKRATHLLILFLNIVENVQVRFSFVDEVEIFDGILQDLLVLKTATHNLDANLSQIVHNVYINMKAKQNIVPLGLKLDEKLRKLQECQILPAENTDVAKIHNKVIGAGGKLIQPIMSECGGVSFNNCLIIFTWPKYLFTTSTR